MKKISVLFTIILIALTSQAQNTWIQKADFAGPFRERAVGFSIGSKGYIGTGAQPRKKDFWEYDPAADAWTQKADFGGKARYGAVGFSIGNRGFIGTGNAAGGYEKDFWEYNPANNNWIQKADFGGTARTAAVGFSIGSKGYVGTGDDGSYEKDFWEYDPSTDTWTQKADFGGTARVHAVGFSIGSKGYIGTGSATDGLKSDFWEYDPSTDTWTQKADFGGTVREAAVGFSIDNKGYIGTGQINFNRRKDFWEYDPATNDWTKKAPFGGKARKSAVGFSIGSKGYIGTGGKEDFWEYTPDMILNFARSNSSVCGTFCINFYDSTFNNATAWQWIFEGGDPSSSTEQNPTNICYDLPGVYDVTLIATNANDVDTFFKPNYITVNATPPIPVITQTGYTLTSSAADFYQWQFNTVDIPGATNQSYDAMQTGYYTIVTSDANGCASSTTLYVEITGIENLFSDQSISVFPNPTNGVIMIDLSLGDEENTEAKIEVLNLLGQIIISENATFANGKLQKEMKLNDEAADGIYLVKVTINDRVYSAQINLQK